MAVLQNCFVALNYKLGCVSDARDLFPIALLSVWHWGEMGSLKQNWKLTI